MTRNTPHPGLTPIASPVQAAPVDLVDLHVFAVPECCEPNAAVSFEFNADRIDAHTVATLLRELADLVDAGETAAFTWSVPPDLRKWGPGRDHVCDPSARPA